MSVNFDPKSTQVGAVSAPGRHRAQVRQAILGPHGFDRSFAAARVASRRPTALAFRDARARGCKPSCSRSLPTSSEFARLWFESGQKWVRPRLVQFRPTSAEVDLPRGRVRPDSTNLVLMQAKLWQATVANFGGRRSSRLNAALGRDRPTSAKFVQNRVTAGLCWQTLGCCRPNLGPHLVEHCRICAGLGPRRPK